MSAESSSDSGTGHTIIAVFLLLLSSIVLPGIPASASAAQLTVSILAPASLLSHTVAKRAVDDSLELVSRSFPRAKVSLNDRHARISLRLPEIAAGTSPEKTGEASAILISQPFPDQSYRWSSRRSATGTALLLSAATPEAVAAGLYGLLQEQLGIRFIHPRQTIIPLHRHWPLKANSTFSGRPRFRHQGFHLHTLHPTELTEQLHNPTHPAAFEDVAAYLDWLARNGQNTFQFFLLRGIDRTAWLPHARRIVAYAHSRGIRCGIEISLAMVQQQAFQAITLLRPFPSYRRQVEATLAWLFQIPWDIITLESMMGEHLPLMSRLLPDTQRHLEELVTGHYQRRLLYATHVIRRNDAEKVRRPLHPASGILIHTVMCYSASETKAPVYGNLNQRFMLEAAKAESGKRETWYWPESSYWVGFDSPVPLLLLPYLDSRWHDINTMSEIGVQGHLTFSSGWEWGYWLVDWSIARWSWSHRENGRQRATSPLSRIAYLFPDPAMTKLWQQALSLQNRFLKDRELLRFMASATPFAELPAPFDLPFQPVPDISYRQLLRTTDDAQIAKFLKGPVTDLELYAAGMTTVTVGLTSRLRQLRTADRMMAGTAVLAEELITGLEVTALRAHHRALVLQALTAKHRDSLGGRQAFERFISSARSVRQQALLLVKQREAHYRYPVELLAARRSSLSAYPFGYLYPAATLFFWEREEEQARHERFDPFFMNLWDIPKTLGLGSLIVR